MRTPLATKQVNFTVCFCLMLMGFACYAFGAKGPSALLLMLTLILYHVQSFRGKI
jgi:hypothetical protein